MNGDRNAYKAGRPRRRSKDSAKMDKNQLDWEDVF